MRIIKIPSSQGGLGKADGTELAPDAVIKQTEDFYLSEEGVLPHFEIDEVKVVPNNIEETNSNIYTKAKEVMDQKPLFIGGDHSVSYPIIKAFSESFENPGIVVFDAHPDAENDFRPPTQEDNLITIVNENLIKKENIILVGIRNWHDEEIKFIKENKIKYFNMKEISFEGIHNICDAVMSVAKEFGALYISIDIDVVDAAFVPGTGWREPGGLTSRELLYFLQRLKLLKNIKALDLVEINPRKDINDLTTKLGAKILVELS
jgi:formiminoglutamase